MFLAGGGKFPVNDFLESGGGLSAADEYTVDKESRSSDDAGAGSHLKVLVDLSPVSAAAQAGIELLTVQLKGACVLEKAVTILLARIGEEQIVILPVLALVSRTV